MERILSEKVNYLTEILGYDVSVVTTEQQNRSHFYPFSKKIKFYHLDINYDVPVKGFLKKIYYRLKKQRTHRYLMTEILKKSHYDVAVSMFEREASFLYKIQDGSKKCLELHFSRFVRTQRNPNGIRKILAKVMSYMDEMYAKKYDSFVVLTNEDKGYWRKCDNIHVIPNPAIKYNDLVSTLTNKQVTAIGRLDYQKGFDSLIRAWRDVHKICPEWKLQIYGSGELENTLISLIRQYNLQDNVFINPPTSNIGEVYNKSSIVVSSSRYEGFPLVLLESLSCGVPVVSYTYKCGPKDLIESGKNGLLVEYMNEKQLSEALISIMTNDELRNKMGRESYLRSLDFTLDKIMQKWNELFQSLV